MKITPYHFDQILKKGYSLDLIYLLELVASGEDISSFESQKVETFRQTLLRKNLLTEDGHLSIPGKELLSFMESEGEKKLEKRKDITDEFNRWWSLYPGTSSFTYRGRNFEGTRILRKNKEVCKGKFARIIQEGEYNTEDLCEALHLQVDTFQRESFKSGRNELHYMQGSDVYLNQRTFEVYVEKVRKGEIPKDNVSRGIDI